MMAHRDRHLSLTGIVTDILGFRTSNVTSGDEDYSDY
jgi:hypothetical protein